MNLDEAEGVLRDTSDQVVVLCRELGREDLAVRTEDVVARIGRDVLVVAVTGEFKRGKSSLVNGLLGVWVCPVAPDRSTAIPTIFRHGEANAVSLTVAEGQGQRVVKGVPADLNGMVLEGDRDVPGLRRLVAVAEIPNRFLESGFSLIDTPGVGGLGPGYGEAVVNLGGVADAAIVVADAGAPLNMDTIAFVEKLSRACPALVVALSRADLYRHGGAAGEIGEQLSDRGIEADVIPISNSLRREALRTGDAQLNEESGFPALLAAIESISSRREVTARVAAEAKIRGVVGALSREVDARQARAASPMPDWATLVAEARAALDSARKDAARWPTMLNDGVSDAATAAEFDLRAGLRRALKEFEEELELGSGAIRVEEFRGRVQARVQTELAPVFEALESRLAGVERELHSLFESEPADTDVTALPPDLPSEWGTPQGRQNRGLKAAAGGVYGGLRGAQSGIMLVGVFAGIAGFGLGTLALVGIGAAFGGKQLMDERGKRALSRRQQARTAVRQFIDEVQVQAARTVRDVAREQLRRQREVAGERAAACVARRAEALRLLEEERERTVAERAAQARALEAWRSRLDRVAARLASGSDR